MNILPEDTPQAAALRDELREKRGSVHLEVGRFLPSATPPLAGERGFEIPPEWTRVSSDEGLASMVRLLARDPGAGPPAMTFGESQALGERVRGLFSERAVFYTNGRAPSGTPRTEESFDSGILVVDGERAGLLWGEDED